MLELGEVLFEAVGRAKTAADREIVSKYAASGLRHLFDPGKHGYKETSMAEKVKVLRAFTRCGVSIKLLAELYEIHHRTHDRRYVANDLREGLAAIVDHMLTQL